MAPLSDQCIPPRPPKARWVFNVDRPSFGGVGWLLSSPGPYLTLVETLVLTELQGPSTVESGLNVPCLIPSLSSVSFFFPPTN